jgi:ABC-type branched-subunit amino acid transport system ATPase component
MAILELKNLYKSFDGVKAVDDVSLSIHKGAVASIIGQNGAGKTTLLNLIDGFVRQDTGTVCYKGTTVDSLSPSGRARLGIGRLWQDGRLFKNMSVLENLLVASKNQPGEGILNCLLRYKRVSTAERTNLESVEKILSLTRLEPKRNALAMDLSYGQQKLLAIGRLLMNEAEFLLLDEPTTSLDPVMIDELLTFIKGLAADGRTILMIEHNVPKAVSISDKVFIMNKGRIVFEGGPSENIFDVLSKESYWSI